MKFKNHHILTLVLPVLVLLSGCYKDDSNEGMTPINKIEVTDVKSTSVLTVFQGDTLKLSPKLDQSIAKNMDQLEFKWVIYNSNGAVSLASPRSDLASGYELKQHIDGTAFVLGEPYVIRFTVTDKASRVTYYLNYNIAIGNKYVNGWITLEDNAGKGDLSFVFPDHSVEHGIYSDRNTTVLTGPKKLQMVPFTVTDDMSTSGKRLYILSESGSQEYNYLTMVKKFDYSYEFFAAPAIQKPAVMTWFSTEPLGGTRRSSSLGLVINNGKAHTNLVGGFPGIKKWGDVALTPENNINYSLAPFAVGGPSYPAIVYDNTSKRFFHIRGFNPSPVAGSLETFPSGSSSGVSSVFDMNNVGMTMAFLDSADVLHEYSAVMKDESNIPYILRFKTANTTQAPIITLKKTQMNAPGILDYAAAAGSTSTPHIYYANGNVISRYETSSNTVLDTYSMPAGENVTAMRYAKYSLANGGPRLAVATWNGVEGKVYYYALNSVGSLGAYTHLVTGFKKVVDLVYKY